MEFLKDKKSEHSEKYEYYALDSMTFNLITKGIAVSTN